MIDATLWVAGRPGGIQQRQRLPLVLGLPKREGIVSTRDKSLVVHLAKAFAARAFGVINVDNQQFSLG